MLKIKELYRKWKRKKELRDMDFWAAAMGTDSWSLFPPSFYATHTPEEARQAEEEALECCRKLLEELDK